MISCLPVKSARIPHTRDLNEASPNDRRRDALGGAGLDCVCAFNCLQRLLESILLGGWLYSLVRRRGAVVGRCCLLVAPRPFGRQMLSRSHLAFAPIPSGFVGYEPSRKRHRRIHFC